MHKGKTIGIIVLTLLAHSGFSQREMNTSMIETTTYKMYSNGQWKELINFGKQALDEGYDYFYLRYRIGTAYYNLGQFRLAVNQFRQALNFNSSEASSQEYLYYSLLYSGQVDESRKLSKTFSPDAHQRLKDMKWSPINYIAAEGGTKISTSSLYPNPTYFQLSLSHSVANRFSLTHAFTTYYQAESRGTIAQRQYFVQLNLPLGRGWLVSPSIHLVNLNFTTQKGAFNYRNLVTSLNFLKSFAYMDFSIGASYSDVLIRPQYIQQTRVAFYPMGKTNFSFGGIAYIHKEDNSGVTSDGTGPTSQYPVTVAFNPFINMRFSSRLDLYASYFRNLNENIPEANGYLINNSQDLTLSRWVGVATYKINEHWDLYGVYQYETKQLLNSFSYQNNVLLIGLKFNPLLK